MKKIYCSECGTELDDSVKFCSNCGTSINEDSSNSVKDNSIKKTNSTIEEVIKQIQIMPIIVGCVLIAIIWLCFQSGIIYQLFPSCNMSMLSPQSVAWVIAFGTLISGLLCKKSIFSALICGFLISLIMEMIFDQVSVVSKIEPEYYFLCIIWGIMGSFIGSIIRIKLIKK